MTDSLSNNIEKCIKITKEQSEAIYRRRDNTMTKRKRTNRNNGLQEQKLHTKLQIEQHESKKNRCELGCVGRVCSSCSTSVTCRVTLVKNPVTAMNQERMGCDYDNGNL